MTTWKNKRTELGSNEAGAQWSLEDEKEAALNNAMNSNMMEVINKRVAKEKANRSASDEMMEIVDYPVAKHG